VSGESCWSLEALRARQREACEAFVDAHYRGVYRFFAWLTGDREGAADLTQETFAAFWESTDRLEAAGDASGPDLKAWLYGIARNRWRKRCRDDRAVGSGLPGEGAERSLASLDEAADFPDGAPGPEALAMAALDATTAARAVAGLPPDYREALVLRVFQELSYGQIAEALCISEGLARWRVHRARAWLRAALEPDWAQEKEKAGAR
jgi:RNA polymerase sigma-70 factor, ECF subfamily